MLKKSILPVLSLLIFASVSYGISYETNDKMASFCNVGGQDMELFKIAEKYMNTELSIRVVKGCCHKHGTDCKWSRTVEGNSLAHLAAYAGDTELLEKLIKEEGFPNEQWQLVTGGARFWRTTLMYGAEEGHVDTVKSLVTKLGANPNTVNDDGKRAIDLARDAGHMDVVAILEPFLEDDDSGSAAKKTTENKKDILLAAEEIQKGEYVPKVQPAKI